MTSTVTTPLPPKATGGRSASPARKVRVPWLAAGLGLVLATTVLVLWGFSRASDRTEVLMITEPVAEGTPIPSSALGTTFIASDDGLSRFYRAGTDLSDVVAATDLEPGDVLGPAMVSGAPKLPEGWTQVGGLIRVGRYPGTLEVGDELRAVWTGDGAGGEEIDEVEATVVDFDVGEDSNATVVLAVPGEDSASVARWATEEELALVRIP